MCHRTTTGSRPLPLLGVRRSPVRRPVRSSPLSIKNFGSPAPSTQPLEPILFPKLRIYFADFPYSHSSLNYRLLTLETCCGLWYGYKGEALYAIGIFMIVLLRTPCTENRHTLMHLFWPISEQVHSRSLCALRRKDNSSEGQ